ncbi:hypothetical protein, partial [Providencia stuartii]|uniref:hypothetical protein n=1 Tax=Providencia stuartii TaxID=588 RepID=UPI0013D14006
LQQAGSAGARPASAGVGRRRAPPGWPHRADAAGLRQRAGRRWPRGTAPADRDRDAAGPTLESR